MPVKPKGFAALTVVSEGVTEKTHTIFAFPRATAEERTASLALLENEEIFPYLSEEDEEEIRNLLQSEEGEVDPVEVVLSESNYALLISLISEGATTSEFEAEAVQLEGTEFLLNDENDRLCDGSSRKETLKHAREAFKTISRLATEVAEIKSALAHESTPPAGTAFSPDTRLALIHSIRVSEKTLGNTLTEEATLEALSDDDLITTSENLYQTVFAVQTSDPDLQAPNDSQESQDEDTTQETEDTPVLQVENPTLGTPEDVQNNPSQETDAESDLVLDPETLARIRRYAADGQRRRARD